MRSRTIDLDGPIHVADFGGEGPALVLVHGLGGSHANWLAAGPLLAARARVVAPDMPGFGRSPPDGRRATFEAGVGVVARFVEAEVGGPAVLVGNSFGGMISMAVAARHPAAVAGLVLVDPAMPRARGAPVDRLVATNFAAYAVPGIGEAMLRRRAARLGAEGMARETLAMCCVDPSRVPPEVVEAMIALGHERLTSMPWAPKAFLEAARSMLRALAMGRSYRERVAAIRAPALIVHGARDRLVPLASAEALARLRPDWAFEVFDDIGHVPQLEAADRFASTVLDWLAGPGKAAAEAATA